MMAETPEKLVHWALDISQLGSPMLSDTSTEYSSSSSLQYINSQLIAHGFTQGGLSLDGLAKDEIERIVKCLLGMLSQRINDMTRAEELTTKIRTLSYDHERLLSMYRTSTETAATAERETNLHKSRLTAATRTLRTAESAHKHTTSELQRTRTALQALRATHQAELRKVEKEKERMVERWSKLSDSQLKQSQSAAGMRCANAEVIDNPTVQMRGVGKGFLEVSLEQAEQARKELVNEVRRLRSLIVSAANELQNALYTASGSDDVEEPAPLTLSSLFPLSTDTSSDKLTSLLATVRETLRKPLSSSSSREPIITPTQHKPQDTATSAEIERLKTVITTLRTELDTAQKQSSTYATQVQAMFDKMSAPAMSDTSVGDMSVDLITAPIRDAEKARLDARNKELEQERQRFTEAAVRLGKEKAALEAERIRFFEEKRAWQVDCMLADLPPTPAPFDPTPIPAPAETVPLRRSPRKSPRKALQEELVAPRKSPSKAFPVGKTGSGKKTRVSRRSSVGLGSPTSKLKGKHRVTPAFETEVIAIPPSPLPMPAFMTSLALSPQKPLLEFVLPPPSPAAALPSAQTYNTSHSLMPPLPRIDFTSALAPSQSHSVVTDTQPSASTSAFPASTSAPELTSATTTLGPPAATIPATPARAIFPMAKPLAQRMIHAYSPVRPSPLSRILMLANSPNSPPSLDALMEETESEMSEGSPTPMPPLQPAMSLAQELGITEEDEETPKEVRARTAQTLGPVRKASKRLTAAEKGKSKAVGSAAPRAPAVMEKENNLKRTKGPGAVVVKPEVKKVTRAKPAPVIARPAFGAPKLPPGKGGARRVPIDSAEAAPIGPARKRKS